MEVNGNLVETSSEEVPRSRFSHRKIRAKVVMTRKPLGREIKRISSSILWMLADAGHITLDDTGRTNRQIQKYITKALNHIHRTGRELSDKVSREITQTLRRREESIEEKGSTVT